jgi:hypothetical protein
MSSLNANTITGSLAANRTTITIKAGGTSSNTNTTPVASPSTMDGTSSNNFDQMARSSVATGIGLNLLIAASGVPDPRSYIKGIHINVPNEFSHKITFDGLNQKLYDVELSTTGLIVSRDGRYYLPNGTLVGRLSAVSGAYGASDKAAINGRNASGYYYYRLGRNSITKGLNRPTT